MNRKIVIIISAIIVTFFVLVGIQLKKPHSRIEKENKVIAVGLKPSQQEHFSKQLSNSFHEVELLKKGRALIEQGKSDEAIVYFNNLMGDKTFELKGLVKEHLIDAYEKKRDYNKAYAILYDDVQKYKISPEHEFRIPVEERLKYLKYASDGEYELAAEHAQLSLEASRKLPLKNLSELYQQRLTDLIAEKDYILSLKKK